MNTRNWINRHIRWAGLCLVIVCSCDRKPKSENVVRRDGEPDVVKPSDEALMERAVQKAKDTHLEFVAALQTGNKAFRGFAVKKGFPTPDGESEHIWINDVAWDGTQFKGVVNNEPIDTKAVAIGDRVTVTPAELSDWMYVNNGQLVGGYTIRVLHYEQSLEEQRAFTKQTGITVPPVDF